MFPRLRFLQHDNPIERAEFTHQRTAKKQGRQLWGNLVFILLATAVMGTFCAFGSSVAIQRADRELLWIVLFGILTLLNWMALGQALEFSANAIVREKTSGRWEALLLTPSDARQIVRGKWWATLFSIWQDYRYLFWIRMAAVTFYWLAAFFHSQSETWYLILSLVLGLFAAIVQLPIIVGMVTALGLLASTLSTHSAVTAGLARLFYIVICAALLLMLFIALMTILSPYSWFYAGLRPVLPLSNTFFGTGLSPLDSGIILAMSIAVPDPVPYSPILIWLCLLCSAGLFATLTWIFLSIAEWRIVRQSALLPESA